MKRETFELFWNKWSSAWFESHIETEDGEQYPVAKLCEIKPDYGWILHKRYELTKETVKEFYFKYPTKLNSYRRAAVILYVINESSPLIYKNEDVENDMDSNFLKQRLALYVALGSIVQTFPENKVKALPKPLFQFDKLNKNYKVTHKDSILECIYRDVFLSGNYGHLSVLTMSNVLWLLVECASELHTLNAT